MKNLIGILQISILSLSVSSCVSSKTDLEMFDFRFKNQYWESLHQVKLNQTLWRDSLSSSNHLDTILQKNTYSLEVTTHSGVILKSTFKLTGTSPKVILSLDSLSNFQLN